MTLTFLVCFDWNLTAYGNNVMVWWCFFSVFLQHVFQFEKILPTNRPFFLNVTRFCTQFLFIAVYIRNYTFVSTPIINRPLHRISHFVGCTEKNKTTSFKQNKKGHFVENWSLAVTTFFKRIYLKEKKVLYNHQGRVFPIVVNFV